MNTHRRKYALWIRVRNLVRRQAQLSKYSRKDTKAGPHPGPAHSAYFPFVCIARLAGGGAENRNLLAPSPWCGCKQRRATTTYRLQVPLGTPPLLTTRTREASPCAGYPAHGQSNRILRFFVVRGSFVVKIFFWGSVRGTGARAWRGRGRARAKGGRGRVGGIYRGRGVPTVSHPPSE